MGYEAEIKMLKSNRKTITQKSKIPYLAAGSARWGFDKCRAFSSSATGTNQQKNASSFVVGYYGERKTKPILLRRDKKN